MWRRKAGGREGERGSSSSTCVQSPGGNGAVKRLPKGYQEAAELVSEGAESWRPSEQCRGRAEHAFERGGDTRAAYLWSHLAGCFFAIKDSS